MLPEAAVKDTELKLARSGLEHVASPLPEVAAPENERKVFINLLHRRYIRFFSNTAKPYHFMQISTIHRKQIHLLNLLYVFFCHTIRYNNTLRISRINMQPKYCLSWKNARLVLLSVISSSFFQPSVCRTVHRYFFLLKLTFNI